jgi:hypothetical protein
VLETRNPSGEIFRIGRKPNPWQPPDWSRSNPDGTFGNRFDDPEGYYRVLYASSQKVSCFIETLARFRPDLTFLAELREIDGDNDFFPLGEVPREWCDQRLFGAAFADGNYADICASQWIAFLRRKLADECLRLGLRDLDAAVLQRDAPRRITQLASLQVYELGLPGIYYRSRYGHDLENWALFEPFQITPTNSGAIASNDSALLEVLKILGLRLSD